ncbi:lytic transglycosylase domain-containing protein [Roseomonas sp. GC11]|uniref:transglycosylase SLT domain-containing protein n=1 Tax=Roseomonas sp. GC11 TaxID=2950546 RepID=UPI00210BEE75|nr:transglycosylase SLT domain-containing protein [Roseomonas sp. GC11]MCQ4160417.1 lytic transglycosylase domain-containing protein [Roseomonas sp. GC11]
MILGALVLAAPVVSTRPAEAGPRNACLAAVRTAELKYDLPEGLLVAVALAESGLHAHALNIGGRAYYPQSRAEARAILARAPAKASVMAGCVQVNARVHARNGNDWPLDPERSADWAARYLRMHYDAAGNWAVALRRWNGGGHAAVLVCRVDAKLQVVKPGSGALGHPACGGARIAQVRRDGAALLELAEAGE